MTETLPPPQHRRSEQPPGHSSSTQHANPRNAGRKKSNPVWEFFTDLRAHGLSGVRCRFCHWITNDRSPTTMKFHLKRKHDTGIGGLWAICEEKIGQQTPQNYARRSRATSEREEKKMMSSMQEQMLSTLLHQAAHAAAIGALAASQKNLPNRSCSLDWESCEEKDHFVFPKMDEGEKDADSLLLEAVVASAVSSNAAGKQGGGGSSSFSLSDDIGSLSQIAVETGLQFTFNANRTGEFYYESCQPNKDERVTFCDGVTEVRVIHSVGGEEKMRESWLKSDIQQFLWAVRGACSVLLNPADDN